MFLLAGLLTFSASARADEIELKDGSKLVGTIVGFENGNFKIETAYGFALVRKEEHRPDHSRRGIAQEQNLRRRSDGKTRR